MKKLLAFSAWVILLAAYVLPIAGASYTVMYRETDGLHLARSPKIINICTSGCQYTTLNSACAANTSTSSSPLIFYVHAGQYSSATQQTCSGQDYATIMGDGPSSRIINTEGGLNTDPNGEGAGDYGTIGMGTSTNWTIHDIYLKGHRTIYMDGNGTGSTNTGGGNVSVYNTAMETLGVQPNEDCIFLRDPAAGTEYHFYSNVCTFTTDGFTNISGATKWYVGGNVFKSVNETSVGQAGGAYALQAIPSIFIDQGSTMNIGGSKTGSGVAVDYAYWFNGGAAAGGDGTECTSGCYAIIQSPVVRLANTDSSGDGATNIAIKIESGATHLASLDIHNPDIKVTTTDSSAGSAYGLYMANATTAVSITGGRIRTSGGATNQDITETSGTNPITVAGLDYTGDGSKAVALDQRRMKASTEVTFGSSTPSVSGQIVSVTSDNSPVGIRVENMDATNDEYSPSIQLVNSVHAGAVAWGLQVDNNDAFRLIDGAGNSVLVWNNNLSGFAAFNSNTLVSVPGGMFIPNGTSPTGLFADGGVGIDTTANQFKYYSGAVRTLDPVRDACFTSRGIAATDDGFIFFLANQAMHVESAHCFCVGTCSTVPTLTFQDNDGNDISLDSSPLSCAKTTSETAFSTFTTSDTDRALVAGEGIAFNVTNSPTATTDWVTVCITYTVDSQ